MKLTPIGIIHSPHQRADGTPVQAGLATGVPGTVEVFPEYAAAADGRFDAGGPG
jgi:tRNA (Thr-GGU) A37 N-methylase